MGAAGAEAGGPAWQSLASQKRSLRSTRSASLGETGTVKTLRREPWPWGWTWTRLRRQNRVPDRAQVLLFISLHAARRISLLMQRVIVKWQLSEARALAMGMDVNKPEAPEPSRSCTSAYSKTLPILNGHMSGAEMVL